MTPTHPQKTQQPIRIIGEHKFYDIRQADQILRSRFMVAEIQEIYIRSGISEGFLKEISKLLIDRALDAKDMRQLKQDVIAIGQNLQGRLGMLAEKKMYEELACVYFMLEDEPEEYDQEWQTKKKSIWKEDSDFFIMEAFNSINASQTTSAKDLLAVWQAVEERINQLPQLTPTN
jgi:hypothetical protein